MHFVYISGIYECLCVRVSVCVCVCMHVRTYVVCMYVFVYVWVYYIIIHRYMMISWGFGLPSTVNRAPEAN